MKKPKSGKKGRRDTIIALVVIMIIIPAGIYYYNQQKMSQENTVHGITSGPFTIDKEKYRLGDYIFMVVTGLKPTDAGKMVIYDPKGGIATQIPFNGTMKSDWNYMFKPDTLASEKLCTPQDLVGNWSIVFPDTSYSSITFQVINEWVQGSEAEIKAIPHGVGPC